MTPQEIINEIHKLPIAAQTEIKKSLLENSVADDFTDLTKPLITEEEFAERLLAKGVIRKIPVGVIDKEDDFEPVEIAGEPLSEMIIRERR